MTLTWNTQHDAKIAKCHVNISALMQLHIECAVFPQISTGV